MATRWQRRHVVALLGLTPLVAGVLTWFVLWRSLPHRRGAGPAAVPAAQALFGLLVVVPAVIVESRAALRQ